MACQFMHNPLKLSFIFLLLIFFLLILSGGSVTAADDGIIRIGAIMDDVSREGKEQITAMKIAVEDLNNSTTHKFTLHFSNISRHDPLHAATAAEQLIKDEEVGVIMGTQTWQEAGVVADIGSRAQVPFISLASAATTPPLAQTRWPFLVQMARNRSREMQSIAAIVQSYNWKRVITIYEDDTFSGDYGLLTLLSDELQSVGSQVEHRLVLPPFSLLRDDDVEGLIREEVAKLLSKTSRVFIVAHSSLPLANRLFTEAKRIGLMGRDSVWLISDSISSLLDSVEPSIITSMEGVIGTKSYFSEDMRPFLDFKVRFRETFRSDYPGEDNLLPGFHALRAYDSVMVIGRGVTELGGNYNSNSTILLESLLSSNFTGLTGDIRFHDQTLSNSPVFRIINVVGKSYRTLGFWSSEVGFSESVDQVNRTDSMTSLTGIGRVVNWPGDLTRVPKGWALPTDAKKMKIGIPGKNAFPKLVTVPDENSKENKYTGFCIEVFYEVLEVLKSKYPLPYEFIPSKSEEMYDMLIEQVINKTVDGVVGDITILANRSEDVEFTMPYAESGLTMFVQVKHGHHKAWMFLKPFTVPMWIVTFGILLYTMCIVWIMEHQSNPEFKGLIKDQFSMALWFTFSTLFFAHREKVYNNLTKIVVVVWLFVVLILSSSYTASLSSMLTVPKLEPKVKDIEWIRSNNAPVGCDEDSFVKRYLRDVLELKNLKTFHKQSELPDAFNNGSIKAAFLEIPYLKLFMQNYTTGYTAVGPTYRFGGLGFAFQKGSPIARDVSEAILAISENGALKKLEKEWLSPPESTLKNAESERLTLKSFWGIYVISGATSTVCLLIFIVKLLHKKYYHSENTTTNQENAHGTWGKAVELVRYLHNKETRISPRKAPSFKQGNEEWSCNSRWELVSPSEMVEHPIRPTQFEIPIRNDAVVIANHVER